MVAIYAPIDFDWIVANLKSNDARSALYAI